MAEEKETPVEAKSHPLRDATDAALNFLAGASNETLGACAVGLCASTYFVLGRAGLLIIGAVGGIVLHATWENHNAPDGQSSLEQAARKRRELGIEVAKRALDWRNTTVNSRTEKVEATTSAKALDYSTFRPATGKALTDFTDAVIRDYVKWWYWPLLPNESTFPDACRQTLAAFILSISTHLSHKRAADPFLDFLANSTSIVIVFLNELATALRASQRQEPEEAIKTYLEYRPESNLANVLSSPQQEQKLNLVADDILQSSLDNKAYSFPPARTFLREVLAKLVLGTTLATCSKPEWINGWIVYLLEDGEPELLNVIDSGVEDMGSAIQNAKRDSANSPQQHRGHQRRMSKAEEAMQDALLEAQRMNELIAEDEARRKRKPTQTEATEDAVSSTATTEIGMATPTTSDESEGSSMVLDNEGVPQVLSSLEKVGHVDVTQLPDEVRRPGDLNDVLEGAGDTPAATMPSLQPVLSQSSDTTQLVLTLHNAAITIFDDYGSNDRSVFKQKPTSDYLLQIEPAASRFPGWMISRRYFDFETLHESLRRIAIISGVPEFAQQHTILPTWKARAHSALTHDLELYLRDALRFERLAESEAMKKFLDKEAGLEKAPSKNKNVLAQGTVALETVGKGFVNVLGQGSKGIAGGGKAMLGGVQGVFGAVATGVSGQRRLDSASTRAPTPSRSPLPRSDSYQSRVSQDGQVVRASFEDNRQSMPSPARRERSPSYQSRKDPPSRPQSMRDDVTGALNLPPPPSQMTEDYVPARMPPKTPPRPAYAPSSSSRPSSTPSSRPATPTLAPVEPMKYSLQMDAAPEPAEDDVRVEQKKNMPITEEETRISVELMFAIITELYSLSGAWTIRLSLLSAAKTFLLRPNNPQIESIRALMQDSVIDTNFSDKGLAAHIVKLRENTLPTEEERKMWPAEMTVSEKKKLRVKARKLLIARGMPQALTSVMGAAASGEALGKVFDCLQVEEVARGLIFALLLQGLRAATQ